MRTNRKYLLAVGLLAFFAIVFGVIGTVAPPLAEENGHEPQQESPESVGHFQNPPSYDSGWINITSKCGQYFNVTHNLDTTEVFVDITGKQTLADGEHKKDFGGTGCTPGWAQKYGTTEHYDGQILNSIDRLDEHLPFSNVSQGSGYVLAGYTDSLGAGSSDFWLVRTDASGNMLWNKTYGGTGDDKAYSVDAGVNYGLGYSGGYAIAGYTDSLGAGSSDFWLVRTDEFGNVLWSQTYGGTGDDKAYSIVATGDGYAITGYTNSFGNGDQAYLVKTDLFGTIVWDKTYGGTNSDYARSLVRTGDGGYALAGYTNSYGSGGYDFWLVKTDSAGNIQWNKTYGGTNVDDAYSLVQTGDAGYAMAGQVDGNPTTGGHFALIKTDASGNQQWNKTYHTGLADKAYAVIQTNDGGYALSGTIGGIHNTRMLLVKTDSSGVLQWGKQFGSFLIDTYYHAYSVIGAGDGGYTMLGEIMSYGPIYYTYLIKTEVESGLAWTDSTANTMTLYRGTTDTYWNYVRLRIWLIQEPSWIYGDINMDGVVDAKDLYILGRNYGKTFSLLSLSGIIAVAGMRTVKKRRCDKQPS